MGKNSEKRGNGMGTQVEKLDVGVEGRKWKRQADASCHLDIRPFTPLYKSPESSMVIIISTY